MTNYHYFPKHRRYGIVIKFSDNSYSWSENNPSQRKYLAESDYCKNAIEFYVWKNDTTYKSFGLFKEYLLKEDDKTPKSKRTKPLPINEKSNLYFTCKCIMSEICGYPYEAKSSYRALALECKKFLLSTLTSQTKSKKIYDIIFACPNLSFYGEHLSWNKNAWLESSLIVYRYFESNVLIKIIREYEKTFNEEIIFDYDTLIKYFYKNLSNTGEIDFGKISGVKSNISYIPATVFEERIKRFKELYE